MISHFIKSLNKKTGKQIVDCSRDAMRIFMDYQWPGNVRELENAIEHAFVLCQGDRIQLEDLPFEILQANRKNNRETSSLADTPVKKEQLSKESLLALLDNCHWNKAEVARQVGISRTAIWKYMKKWNIPLQRDAG
jgi:DNA-binding NtrC family response regulator